MVGEVVDRKIIVMYNIHHMRRTQIYLQDYLYQDLAVGAKMLEVSMSEYIRRLLDEGLYAIKNKLLVKKEQKSSLMIISEKAINAGKTDIAENFDKYFEQSLR